MMFSAEMKRAAYGVPSSKTEQLCPHAVRQPVGGRVVFAEVDGDALRIEAVQHFDQRGANALIVADHFRIRARLHDGLCVVAAHDGDALAVLGENEG